MILKKKTIIWIYILLCIATAAAVFFASRTYTVYLENPTGSEDIRLEHEAGEESIVRIDKISTSGGITTVRLKSEKPGTESVNVSVYFGKESEVRSYAVYCPITATRAGLLFVNGYDFGGFTYLYLGIAALEIFSCVWLLLRFFYRQKHDFFTYKSVLELALAAFFGVRGGIYAAMFLYTFLKPSVVNGLHIFEGAGLLTSLAVLLNVPIVFVFSLFLSISNIALIRREGFALNNLFGLLISALLAIGSVGCIVLAVLFPDSLRPESKDALLSALRNAISGVFIYLEYLLFSAQFCCLFSAKRKPKFDKDFIIILGCKIRSDGTPLPLLQGRIDCAIRFYKEQLEATGKKACFIPSGGQGADEVMPEARSMERYLIEHGIDPVQIFPETKSATTLENMRFSGQIAAAQKPGAKLVFSTTNYHIFRSGLLARKAGLRAAGIGCKTKWYFWPNAQIREFIGLLASEFKINIALILGVALTSVLFANIASIIQWLIR